MIRSKVKHNSQALTWHGLVQYQGICQASVREMVEAGRRRIDTASEDRVYSVLSQSPSSDADMAPLHSTVSPTHHQLQ